MFNLRKATSLTKEKIILIKKNLRRQQKTTSLFVPKKNKIIKYHSNVVEKLKKNHFILFNHKETSKIAQKDSYNSGYISESPNSYIKNIETNKKTIEDKYIEMVKKKIYKIISKKYSSPYIQNMINRGYNYSIKVKYYNYYLICNLIENKKSRFTVNYYENLLLYDKEEYFIRCFDKNEIILIANYLLDLVYSKDIYTSFKYDRNLTYSEIKNMFNNLINSNLNSSGSLEIIEDIAIYYKQKGINNINLKIIPKIDDNKQNFSEKIKYKYIKDIPISLVSNCMPNYFFLEKDLHNYMKDYIINRKYIKIKKDIEDSKNIVGKDKMKKREIHNNDTKGFILNNFSLSAEKDSHNNIESRNNNENQKQYDSFKKLNNNNDISEIKILIQNLLQNTNLKKISDISRNKTSDIKKISKRIIKRRYERTQSMKDFSINYKTNKDFISFRHSSLSKSRKKTINFNNSNNIQKVFKTSLKTSLNKVNNINNTIKNYKNDLTLNKNKIHKIYLNDKEEMKTIKNYANINKLNYNINKESKFISKQIIKFCGLNSSIKNNLDNKKSIKNDIYPVNLFPNNKEASSKESLCFNKIKNISKFIPQTEKNKYSINKHFSLKKINSYTTKYKYSPKKVIFYTGIKRKPFAYTISQSFEDKKINVWEDNKINSEIVKVVEKTCFLLNKIANKNPKKSRSFQNCHTLEKLIKYPNIYASNLK